MESFMMHTIMGITQHMYIESMNFISQYIKI